MSQSEARAKRRIKKQQEQTARKKLAKKFPHLSETELDAYMWKFRVGMAQRVPELWGDK